MHRFLLTFLIALILLFGSSCSSPTPSLLANASQTETIAWKELKEEILGVVSMFEDASGGSKNPTLISAKPTRREPNLRVEEWIFDSNSKRVTYTVTYTPSGNGLDFVVERDLRK